MDFFKDALLLNIKSRYSYYGFFKDALLLNIKSRYFTLFYLPSYHLVDNENFYF